MFTEDSDIINENGSEDPSQIIYFCGHHKICNKFNNAKVTRITKLEKKGEIPVKMNYC